MLSNADATSKLPLAPEAVLAALVADRRFGHPLSLTDTPIERIHDHQGIYRIFVRGSEALPSSFILKMVQRWEVEIQARIASELDKIVPAVYGHPVLFGGSAKDAVGMLMEDLDNERMHCAGRGDQGSPLLTQQLAVYGEATARLASVHDHFKHALPSLPEPRQLGVGLREAVPEITGLLSLLVSVAGLPVEQAVIEEIGNIGTHFDDYLMHCSSSESLTLIHGDFHLGNVMSNSTGDVRIIDWGAAATGPCEWDLVMCGEPQVLRYLEARTSITREDSDRAFCQRLRSAVVVRMYEFIRAAIGLVFADPTLPFESLLMSIPLYAVRLTEAANSKGFCGGDPLLAASRMRTQ